ncbi:oxidoreductase [Celerinatantimonas sp. YJH-8]|uniref:oxidoreductase n=1 Tax=Celerinatantimonas sp. YJH-8 TaxID=3228714 RepID=UPI0038C71224
MNSTNPVWFITGCSTGFGRELAKQVIALGWNVVITARNPDSLADLTVGHETHTLPLALDVNDQAVIQQAVAQAIQHFGQIDVLVNNAGYGYFSAIEEGEDDQIRRQFETNVFGLSALIREVLPHMRAKKAGHIINFSSIGGLVAFPALGYYNASKFAVEAISEALYKEVQPLGIHVSIVEPSGFRTDWAGRSVIESKTTIDDYKETAGARRDALRAGSGHQAGDPVRAAQAVIDIARLEQPPLRLLLGKAAYNTAMAHLDELRHNFEQWRDVSIGADYPEE